MKRVMVLLEKHKKRIKYIIWDSCKLNSEEKERRL